MGRTWEDVIYISVPIEGGNNESYGVGGLEMNGLMFCLSYPSISGEYGEIVTVLAPMERNQVFIKDGLAGKESELSKHNIPMLKKGKHLNTYSENHSDYIGLHAELPDVFTEDGKAWAVLMLVFEEEVQSYMLNKHWITTIEILLFVFIMFVISMFISKRYVEPIVDSIEKIKSGSDRMVTGISELEALSEFMSSRQSQMQQNPNDLPPNIKELFDNFMERFQKLIEEERGVLHFYIQGYSISEVPELAFISLNTVRKHNRSIYEKMHVSSIDELKLYIDFLRRLDTLDKIR